jgi:hypothetical protein
MSALTVNRPGVRKLHSYGKRIPCDNEHGSPAPSVQERRLSLDRSGTAHPRIARELNTDRNSGSILDGAIGVPDPSAEDCYLEIDSRDSWQVTKTRKPSKIA